ncbi:MAG: ribonuclease H-like domain-containing protein [Dehalococcoidia bacterium]
MITSYSRELTLGIPQGTLIDLETTGLDVGHDEIVLFGYIQGSHLEIICRSSKDEAPFIARLAELVPTLPRPFYAYNLPFEKGFLQAKGIRIEGVDLFQPWKEKAQTLGLKWPKLDELFSHAEQYFNEPVISGRDVPLLWQGFLYNGDDDYLQQIIRHNESDLLRELYLLVYYRDSYNVQGARKPDI